MHSTIRIKLKSFDSKLLYSTAMEVIMVAKRNGSDITGPISFPMKKTIYTVNCSPHINKKSREQFEKRVYKLLLIITPNTQTVDALKKLELPSGVYVEVKLL